MRLTMHHKYLDISSKYLDIFTIHVCVLVCVSSGVRVRLAVRFTQERKERGAVKCVRRNLRFCETRNI